MVYSEVADTNTPDLALLDRLHQRPPSAQSALRPSIRCVKQVQINVLQLRLLQTLVDAPLGILVVDAFRWDLGSVEELFTWDPGSEHAFGCGLLVAVDMCAVYMAVAGLDGMADYIFRYFCRAAKGVSMSARDLVWEREETLTSDTRLHRTCVSQIGSLCKLAYALGDLNISGAVDSSSTRGM